MSSHERFGYEWDKYSEMTPEYERQFLNWTGTLTAEDFKGKKVLDAGCGMGRNSYWPLVYGAKKAVAFDLDSRSVAHTRKTLSRFENAEVLQKDIYTLPWENEFDIAFSIGVIHHLKDPKKALGNLTRALKKGGTLFIWVYGYDGNEWIVRFLNPVRKNITSRLPISVVHALSYFCSIPVWLYVKITGGRTRPYFKQIARFQFWHLHSIIFDQFIPEVANYWKKEEVEKLFDGLPVKNVRVMIPPETQNGWVAMCEKV